MNKKHFFYFLLIFIFLSGSLSLAEEKAEEKPENDQKFSFKAAFGLDLSGGNTDALGLTADVKVSWLLKEKTEIVLSSALRYLETNGEKNDDKVNFQLLFDTYLTKKLTFFIFSKPSRDVAKKIDFRLETGSGFKYDIIDNFKTDKDLLNTDISLSSAVVYELTDREELDKEKIFRLSVRPKIKQQLSESLTFFAIFFWQPKLDNFDDYRLNLETGLNFEISKSISMILKFSGEYNSIVPEGVENEDYRLINQLSINF